MPDIVLSPILDLDETAANGSPAAVNVDARGNVWIAVCLTPGRDRELAPSGVEIPLSRANTPRDYVVFEFRAGVSPRSTKVLSEPYIVHHVHPVLDEILLVSSRSRRRSDDDVDHNGRLYRRSGSFERELLLGDGIQDVQATSSGMIWVSYFDEGVYGNFGWTKPLGSSGLVAWDADGNKRYEFTPPADLEPISDCYALNVASDAEVWLYYYTPFDLVRIEAFQITGHWSTPVAGASAFAVADHHVLLHGGYDQRQDLTLCALEADGDASVISRLHPVSPSGKPIAATNSVGRGDALHLFDGRYVYRVRVSEALGA